MSDSNGCRSLRDLLTDCGLTGATLGSDAPIDTVRLNLGNLGERVLQNGLTTSERLLQIAAAAERRTTVSRLAAEAVERFAREVLLAEGESEHPQNPGRRTH